LGQLEVRVAFWVVLGFVVDKFVAWEVFEIELVDA
jgi:hypothetical protein